MVNLKKSRLKKGVTLIETLLYLTLFGMVFGIVMQVYFSNEDFQRASALADDLERSFTFMNTHLEENIGLADSIEDDKSLYNKTLGALTIDNGGSEYAYSVSEGRLVYFNGTDIFYITNPVLRVDEFFIEQIVSDSETAGVRIQTTVTHRGSQDGLQRSIENTYLL